MLNRLVRHSYAKIMQIACNAKSLFVSLACCKKGFLLTEAAAKHEHVGQRAAVFYDWMIVVVGEEVVPSEGVGEFVFSVKFQSVGILACANKQFGCRVFVAVANKFNHLAAVSFSLMAWGDCQIHQFVLPVSLFRNYGNGNRRVSAIEHGKHVAAFQIAVDHRFLLVAQQEQGEETFFVAVDFPDFHRGRFRSRFLCRRWGRLFAWIQ